MFYCETKKDLNPFIVVKCFCGLVGLDGLDLMGCFMNGSRQLSKEKVMFNSLVDFFFGPREEQDEDELGEITPEAWKGVAILTLGH